MQNFFKQVTPTVGVYGDMMGQNISVIARGGAPLPPLNRADATKLRDALDEWIKTVGKEIN